MIHEEKQTKGRETVKELKSISGVTEVRRGTGKERGGRKHLDHPFTVMHPFVLQHTRTRTHTLIKKISIGRK